MASPSAETHSPAQPCSSTCEAEPASGWQKGCLGVQVLSQAFPSVRASRPPHQPAGLAEGLLLTADTIGLTVNNKTKSLCTALQTLLHPPGCTAELRDRVGHLCSTLHRVLTGNISFPLTTNTSGNGKKGILPPRETKTMPLSKQKLPGFV